jgi:transcriptional regulator with XRE-family HTH domain
MATRITITDDQLGALKRRIAIYLEDNRLTPAQLSDQCWLTNGVVSRIMRGASVPSNATIKHLARGMGYTEEALLAPLAVHEQEEEAPQPEIQEQSLRGDYIIPNETWAQTALHYLHLDLDRDASIPEQEEEIREESEFLDNPFFAADSAHLEPHSNTHDASLPYYDEFEDAPISPYILITKDTLQYQNGMNISHVVTWRDDKSQGALELLFTDGQRMVIGSEQRDIVLAHLRRLNKNLAIV